MAKVLDGVRVLDFSRYAAGPFAAMLLADMGAEVIRVEAPGGSEDRTLGPFALNGPSLPFGIILQRNKKGITLNLRSPKGQELLHRLVASSDIVVDSFSPGIKAEMGLTYEQLRLIKSNIIHVSITAFGQTGPYRERIAFDPTAQAMCGALSYSGFPGQIPTRFQVSWVDNSTGLAAALGAMLALYHCQRTGEGQSVDLALLDTAISFVSNLGVFAEYKLLDFVRPKIGNGTYYGYGDCFPARDGWVHISVISNPIWRRLCQALGQPELARDSRFSSDLNRFQHRQEISAILAPWVAQKTVEEVLTALVKSKVPCGPVSSVAQMIADPQVKAREMLVGKEFPGVGVVPLTGIPIKLSKTPGSIESRAPLVGEYNEEIYCGLLGMGREELEELKTAGVI